MNNLDLVTRLRDIAINYKTLYVSGCFGAPLRSDTVQRYINQYQYNRDIEQTIRNNTNANVYGFDCVNLIKAVLWGWNGNYDSSYGGAVYCSNNVPDLNENGMASRGIDVTSNFSFIEVGEFVHMDGHIGIYIGDGLAVECTPKWNNCVQITAVANIGDKDGYNSRRWDDHGKLPWIDYVKEVKATPTESEASCTVSEPDNHIDIYYNTYNASDKWLGAIANYNEIDSNGYAGMDNKPIQCIAANAEEGVVYLRVSPINKDYLPWVNTCNYDSDDGYAGNKGEDIDRVQMSFKGVPGKRVRYRVRLLNGSWLEWVTEYGDGNDGYAGIRGKAIDAIQCEII